MVKQKVIIQRKGKYKNFNEVAITQLNIFKVLELKAFSF